MGIKPISFFVANLVAQLIVMLVVRCERTLRGCFVFLAVVLFIALNILGEDKTVSKEKLF